MSIRIERVNELIIGELAKIINDNIYLDGGLITLVKVRCSANLKDARVNISVLPENKSGTALELLRKSRSQLTKSLAVKIKMRAVPKLHFVIDNQERYAAEIDKAFRELQ